MWYGIVAWGIVMLGTFAGLVAWWDTDSSLFGYYALWSAITGLVIGASVWSGVHFYVRNRWLVLPWMIVPHAIAFLLVVMTINSKTYNATPAIVIPLVYSIPSVVVAWIVGIIGAERLRRKSAVAPIATTPPVATQ